MASFEDLEEAEEAVDETGERGRRRKYGQRAVAAKRGDDAAQDSVLLGLADFARGFGVVLDDGIDEVVETAHVGRKDAVDAAGTEEGGAGLVDGERGGQQQQHAAAFAVRADGGAIAREDALGLAAGCGRCDNVDFGFHRCRLVCHRGYHITKRRHFERDLLKFV